MPRVDANSRSRSQYELEGKVQHEAMVSAAINLWSVPSTHFQSIDHSQSEIPKGADSR